MMLMTGDMMTYLVFASAGAPHAVDDRTHNDVPAFSPSGGPS